MKKLIVVIILLKVNASCFSQTYNKRDFQPVPPIQYNSNEWSNLNRGLDFSVCLNHDSVEVRKHVPHMSTQAVPGGKLLAFDMGEWGGSLVFQPDDSTKKLIFINGAFRLVKKELKNYEFLMTKRDSRRNIINNNYALIEGGNNQMILPFMGGWLYTLSADSWTSSSGSLNRIEIEQDTFSVTKNFIFKSAPATMAIYKDKIFVVTDKGFYCLNKCYKQIFFISALFFRGLYPNSIAVLNEKHIYVGMRGGYAEINIPRNKIAFYEYKNL